MLDARRRGAPTERINNMPQGEATEGNTVDDSLMVDQDTLPYLELSEKISENIAFELHIGYETSSMLHAP